VENGGYGGRVAAPLAGDVVSAADALGLLKTRDSELAPRDSGRGVSPAAAGRVLTKAQETR
jgi:hypothetical protein